MVLPKKKLCAGGWEGRAKIMVLRCEDASGDSLVTKTSLYESVARRDMREVRW